MRVRPDIVKLDRALIHDIHRDAARRRWSSRSCASPATSARPSAPRASRASTSSRCSPTSTSQWGQGYVSHARAAVDRGLADRRRGLPRSRSPTASARCRSSITRSAPATVASCTSAPAWPARAPADLESALALIAAELGSSKICLSAWHERRGRSSRRWPRTASRTERTIFPIADYPLTREGHPRSGGGADRRRRPRQRPARGRAPALARQRSLLMVPVVSRGESLGIIEAYRRTSGRGRAREINRARVIANQFASVIPMLSPDLDQALSAHGLGSCSSTASDGRGTRAGPTPGGPTSARPLRVPRARRGRSARPRSPAGRAAPACP